MYLYHIQKTSLICQNSLSRCKSQLTKIISEVQQLTNSLEMKIEHVPVTDYNWGMFMFATFAVVFLEMSSTIRN